MRTGPMPRVRATCPRAWRGRNGTVRAIAGSRRRSARSSSTFARWMREHGKSRNSCALRARLFEAITVLVHRGKAPAVAAIELQRDAQAADVRIERAGERRLAMAPY